MIYMAGDNNLSIDMSYALEELRKKVAIDTDYDVNLLVYYQNNSQEIPNLYCDFSAADRPTYYYVPTISAEGEPTELSNTVEPIVDFVDWSVNRVKYESDGVELSGRKAKNYALILSGHSMGFLSTGLFRNESSNVSMTMPGLKRALESIQDDIIGDKVALVGFDSCVMGMLEIGSQLKSVAKTMIASEGTIPNAGWSYSEILETFIDSDIDVYETGTEIVKRYIQKQSKDAIGGVSVDMSAWDLRKLDRLNESFTQFLTTLFKCFADENNPIYNQMRRVLLQVHYDCQTYLCEQSVDLGDFCQLTIKELNSLSLEMGREVDPLILQLSEHAIRVKNEIDRTILLCGYSGSGYQHSNGISLFFPWSVSAYEASRVDYEQMDFVAHMDSGELWNCFIQKYLYEVTLRKATENNSHETLHCNPIFEHPVLDSI